MLSGYASPAAFLSCRQLSPFSQSFIAVDAVVPGRPASYNPPLTYFLSGGQAMSAVGQARAPLDDLYRTPGKAELIGGRIVHQMATGLTPNRVAGRIFRSLDDHSDQSGKGNA